MFALVFHTSTPQAPADPPTPPLPPAAAEKPGFESNRWFRVVVTIVMIAGAVAAIYNGLYGVNPQ